eukprot:13291320-Alexandrium_andersonii.AAC.1
MTDMYAHLPPWHSTTMHGVRSHSWLQLAGVLAFGYSAKHQASNMSGDVAASSSGGPPSDPSELRLRAQRGGRQQRKRALAELSALEGPS